MRLGLFSAALILAGCGDKTVSVRNAIPEVVITSPASGYVAAEGEELTVEGYAGDADDSAETLSARWTVDGEEVCTAAPETDGTTSCTFTVEPGNSEIQLVVVDPNGGAGEDSITISVEETKAPEVVINSPEDESIFSADELITLEATVSDEEDEPEELTAVWTSSLDDDFSVEAEMIDTEGTVRNDVETSELSAGVHALTLTVTDTSGKTGTASVTITVRAPNEGPTCEITAPASGSSAVAGTLVTFEADVTDDQPVEALTIAWLEDGEVLETSVATSGSETSGSVTYATSTLTAGPHNITLSVTDESGATCTDDVTYIVGSPPSVTIAEPVADVRYYAGELIELSGTALDAEDDEEDIRIAWTTSTGEDLSELDTTVNSDGSFSSFTELSRGEHALVVTATDTTGLTSEDTVIITVGDENTPPTCEITDPASGATVPSGTIIFTGVAFDADEPEGGLAVSFRTDGTDGAAGISLGETTSDSSGAVLFTTSAIEAGTHVVRMEVTDEVGDVCSDTIILNVGSAPDVLITTPATGTVINDGESLTFAGSVSDEEDAAAALDVEWRSSIDGTIGSGSPSAAGTVEITAEDLSVGTHTITLTATDTDGESAETTIEITVNGLPSAPTVEIVPATPAIGDSLVATITSDSVDPEGDEITYSYAWTVDDVETGFTDATVPSGETGDGEVWTVTVTAHDASGMGGSAVDSVTINHAPTCAILGPVSDEVVPSGVVDFYANAADEDDDSEALLIEFFTGEDELGTADAASDGAVVFSTEYGVLGSGPHTVTMVVTDSLGDTCEDTVSFDVGSPPSVSITAPEGGAVVNDGETAIFAGTVSDGESVVEGITILWSSDIDGHLDGTSADSSGSVGFEAHDLTIGTHTITLRATDSDGEIGMAEVTIRINGLPTAPTVTIAPASPTTTDDLVATATDSIDEDGDDITYTYAWTVDGEPTDYAGDTIPADVTNSSEEWEVTVTASDGYGTSDSSSASVTVMNTAPVVSDVSLSPDDVYTNDTITATATASDVDGDTTTLSYEWTVSGAVVAGETGDTLSGVAHFDKGDTVFVTVTATDAGGGSSDPVSSTEITVLNTGPTAHTIDIDPDSPIEGEDAVRCNVGLAATDVDGDTITYSVSWAVDGVEYTDTDTTTLAGDTVPGSATTEGEAWTCTMTSSDGEAAGPTASASVTIGVDCDKDDDGYKFERADCETVAELIDCDDADPSINPGATEIWYDGIDSDCSGGSDYDADEDGYDAIEYGGEDCADEDPARIDCSDGIADYSPGDDYGPVAYHTVETDSNNDRLILYGGQQYHQLNGSTNAYNLADGDWEDEMLTAGVDPGERMGHASAMDEAGGKMYVYGGQMYHTLDHELLMFDTSTDTWSILDDVLSSSRPAPLTGASMVYDPDANTLHIFGGQGYHGLNDEHWTYNLTTSTWAYAGTSPVAAGMVAVFNPDAAGDGLTPGIAFGGQTYHKLADTGWCFDGDGFSELTITGEDTLPPAVGMAHAFAPTFGGIVAYGGQTYHNLIGDAYLIRMVGDCTIDVEKLDAGAGAPPKTVGSAMAWSSSDAEAFLIGGQTFYKLSEAVHGIIP